MIGKGLGARAVTQTFGVKAIAYATGAIASIWVARALGPYERGIWSLTLLATGLLALLADGGLSTSSLFVLRKRAVGMRTVALTALRLLAVNWVVWVALGCSAYAWGWLPVEGVSPTVLVVAGFGSLLIGGIAVARQLLNGLGDLAGVNASVALQALALPLALAPALLSTAPSAALALLAYAASLAVCAVATARLLARHPRDKSEPPPGLASELLTYGAKSQAATLLMMLAYRSDLFLVGHFIGVSAAGVYSVALTLSEMLRGVAETAQVLVVARASERNLATHALSVTRQAVLVTALGAFMMAACAWFVVPAVFGEAYEEATVAFWFLCPGVMGLVLSYSLSPLLFLEGRVTTNAVAALAGLVSLWAVGILGPGSASLVKFAFASSVAYWVMACVQIVALHREGKVRVRDLVPGVRDVHALLSAAKTTLPFRVWSDEG